jgi:putative nucleotidyltransferase with HDIG domain
MRLSMPNFRGRSRSNPRRLLIATAGAAASISAAAAWWAASRRERRTAARLHRALVELLLNALTSGDPETARHSRRVANLADAMASRVRIGRDEHATLRVAALLHDLGKIDDRLFPLVHKASPLSQEEREQINHHPRESAEILRPLEPFHHGLLSIVTAHHECWNGGGYPEGRSGGEIPLAARIISIADVFDAMVQPRAYHEPQSVAEVFQVIRDSAGKRFDPELVDLLDDDALRERWIEIAREGRREEARAIRAERPAAPTG